MLGKTAVLITGEYRTWDIAKKYIFNSFDSLQIDIDYYFVTWTTTSEYWKHSTLQNQRVQVSVESLVESFNNKNLMGYRLENLIKQNSGYYLRAHLSRIANILKRKQELENNFVYDQVIEVRPDLHLPLINTELTKCADYEYVIGDIYTHYQELPSIPDLYFRTSSAGNDVLATRNKFDKFNSIKKFNNLLVRSVDFEPFPSSRDPHYILLDFLLNKRMIPLKDQNEALCATVVRPNFPANFGDLTVGKVRELYHEYQKYVDNL